MGLVEAGQQQGDVVVAAVVAHEDAGAFLGDVLQPFYGQGNAGHLQDAAAPAGDVTVDQLLHRLGVAGGQGPLAPAQGAVVYDHVAEQIQKHRNGAKNTLKFSSLWHGDARAIVTYFCRKREKKYFFYNWVACTLAKLTKSGYIYICKASTMALSGCGGLLRNGKERTR